MSIFDSRDDRALLRRPHVFAQMPQSTGGGDPGPIASFALSFNDLGNGQASLVEDITGATATFTRAGATASTVLSNGLVKTGIAANVARAWYDPSTLQYRGYLNEGASTNICLQSEDLGTTWVPTRSSVSVNQVVAPDGNTTADKLIEDATATNTHFIASGTITVTNGAVYTSSVWAQAGTRTAFALAEGLGVTATAYFDLSAGTVGTIQGTGSPSATIQKFPNGWYRCSLTFTASGASARIALYLTTGTNSGNETYSGDGASGAFFWGAQMEALSYPSTYIPTTTVSVTRNTDSLTYPLAVTGGTVVVYFSYNAARSGSSAFGGLFSIRTDTNNYWDAGGLQLANTLYPATVAQGGSTQWDSNSVGLINSGQINKLAVALATNDGAAYLNGSSIATKSTVIVPTSTLVDIGNERLNRRMYGAISRFIFYPPRLPNSIEQVLTIL